MLLLTRMIPGQIQSGQVQSVGVSDGNPQLNWAVEKQKFSGNNG